jgi:hypothetical protein
MPDIGSTVAAKSESVHLDPAVPQLIKIPSGVIYYPPWEHRVLALRYLTHSPHPMTAQIGIELPVHFKPITQAPLQVPMGLTMYNCRPDALTNPVIVEAPPLN